MNPWKLQVIQTHNVPTEWSDWAINHPEAHFFQTPYLFSLTNGLTECETLACLAYDGEGPLASLAGIIWKNPLHLFKSGLSSRLIIIGGPLIRPGLHQSQYLSEQLFRELVNATAQRVVYAEMRWMHQKDILESTIPSCEFDSIPYYNMFNRLSPGEDIENRYSPARKRQLRQAHQAGISVELASSIEEVYSWWKILKSHYMWKLRKPFPSLEFMTRCFEQGRIGGWASILIARRGQRVVGGMLMPWISKLMAHAWYVASEHVPGKEGNPAIALYHKAFCMCQELEIPIFDLMGGGMPAKEYGTRRFKEGFGVTPILTERWRWIKRKNIYRLGNWVNNF